MISLPVVSRSVTGHLVPSAQNQKLFEYLGTSYGGDGKTSFGIPDIDQLAPANCH